MIECDCTKTTGECRHDCPRCGGEGVLATPPEPIDPIPYDPSLARIHGPSGPVLVVSMTCFEVSATERKLSPEAERELSKFVLRNRFAPGCSFSFLGRLVTVMNVDFEGLARSLEVTS